MEYFNKIIEKNYVNAPLINDISKYVEFILEEGIPHIPYNSYVHFYKDGSRKEFEKAYFERRKQLTALGLYLQWNISKKAINYFQELLWNISNEFSWCLVAHLPYGKDEFQDESSKIIDLFSAETAQTLCEILIIHKDKIDKLLCNHIKKQIRERVLLPFINRNWEWETATHNWSAVCGSCIGIVALLMEKDKMQEFILEKVENALDCYIKGFGNDGITLEGIGYWAYGFGYYNYYKALRMEIYKKDNEKYISKIKAIASLPQKIQISEKVFVPFSDVPPDTILPSGLISYLHNKYDIKVPLIKSISSFDFDHCYRWAHISRNLWWTSGNVLNWKLVDISCYFNDAQWMVHRKNKMFFAIKGGNNNEPHNHNDIGSFILAIDGEIILTDLGAGAYTKGYFGNERYTYNHTRSYWHSVPLINKCEQKEIGVKSNVIKHSITDKFIEFHLELTLAYPLLKLDRFYRKAKFENYNKVLTIEDFIVGRDITTVNEGFVSYIKPEIIKEGEIIWKGTKGKIILLYDYNKFSYSIEKEEVLNHYNEMISIYRLGLIIQNKNKELVIPFKFYYQTI
ncbi:heparinase II/III-family protein [Clostridium sp. SHJSY1]|uniref:heparinase II/III domain-containing protein n=1 Tax=Clostridium sp. SHJSY1 TaxID=2942483 RepID=UPI002876FD7B|nr:heparinase II/III family protein [Clostridium sp. SHJSY1]MDS0525790.1 heparinase II/III-family protein [Clostridium sp. SHJSY1]